MFASIETLEDVMKTGTTLSISTQAAFERALKNKSFQAATYVWLDNLPGVTALPEMPAATYVWLDNLPGVTALPEMPVATDVWLLNLPGVTALPEMPAATYVWLLNLPGVTAPPRVHSRGSIYRNGRVWR